MWRIAIKNSQTDLGAYPGPLIRFPRPPEQEHPDGDDHRRQHPGENIQFRVAGADGQIARPTTEASATIIAGVKSK